VHPLLARPARPSTLWAVPIQLLQEDEGFPDPALADEATGILAVGGAPTPGRLLEACARGIFPWYDARTAPVLWHSPAWRMVLPPSALHVPRSVARTLRRGRLTVTFDVAFDEVLGACATAQRPGQSGTWLNPALQAAQRALFEAGRAHSVEAWHDGQLVGGLYGVVCGAAFVGDSMFARAPDASKVCLVEAARSLAAAGFALIDCRVYTAHLARFGAVEWPRPRFLEALKQTVSTTTRPWPPR
jgi:leucyl/phenylalanyl-tRNA--protein transferase